MSGGIELQISVILFRDNRHAKLLVLMNELMSERHEERREKIDLNRLLDRDLIRDRWRKVDERLGGYGGRRRCREVKSWRRVVDE
jgi:hypothetical protein